LEGVGVVVTGAGNGMGKATASALAAEGAGVVVFDVDAEAVEATVQKIAAAGGVAVAAPGDVTAVADLEHAVDTAVSRFGALGVMVNFAGLLDAFAPCLETSEELWDRVLAVNLKGVFLGTKVAAEAMRRQDGRGTIVNMASYAGFMAGGGGAVYAASKAGVIGFTRQVAAELAPIRVNALAPGLVLTDFWETSTQLLGELTPTGPGVIAAQEQVRSMPVENIPLARGAEPEEVARLALFLATDESSYITGQTFLIDGGASIRNGGPARQDAR
jgi:3-oxoacyl-[acyl-carrier protein] reductase